ncbi:hypothetical protein [Actinoplanes regularis]|uniref:Uncharacterized protein n=1 Tax=Actinoplanes regularis TaxID=52697 RepID=A0A239JMF4_9ACTN|nr:hypothetical protein [Actinoplanes regularis]GIE92093.1 hypothetical protein Are01nite_85730 [Actinoplanes regularis]SNT07206.1 hypothetical protein SAMN06264365_13656 [Actinoplanes regularis]
MTVTRPASPNNEKPTPVTHAVIQGVPRAVWMGFALIAGVLVGMAAGLLSAAGGIVIPLAVLAGGGACGSTILLALALVRYATEVHS